MFKKWENFVKESEQELLNVELTFSSMHKGNMHYYGEYRGKRVHCEVSEDYVSNYDYGAIETVASVTQGENVHLQIDEETFFSTH